MKKIYLVPEYEKEHFLTSLSPHLENRSVYTFSSLLKKYPYIHDDKALDYILDKYHVCLDIARIYLKQICLYKVENLLSEKGEFLRQLKDELIDRNLLTYNSLFYEELKSSFIECYLPSSKDLNAVFNDIPIHYVTKEEKNYVPKIYEMDNKELEIAFVGEKIKELLEDGIDINSIYVCNLDDDYRECAKRIFKWQNIAFMKRSSTTLSMTPCGSKFLSLLKENDVTSSLEILQTELKDDDLEIYNQIIDTINDTVLLHHQEDFVADKIMHTHVKQDSLSNVVKEISLEEVFTHENDYIFILQAISSLLPKVFKDEDYLSDEEKCILNVDTSLDKNRTLKELSLQAIKACSHLFITYPKFKDGKECYLSPILEEFKDSINKGTSLTFLASDFYNQIFMAQEMDEYIKYNTISKELLFLNQHYELPYQTYDHSFTGIPYQNKNIFLSYTTLDMYQKCPFQYYISSVLKIKPRFDSFTIFVGNLFHKVLEEYANDNKDYEKIYDREVSKYSWNYKEKFFLTKLKNDLAFIIKTIEEQDSHSLLNKVKTEEKITIENLGGNITFQGKIDKIKYLDNDSNLVAVLIDYKTGNALMKKEYMPLGFHLQLPIYLYLISSLKKEVRVGGIYLQNILPSRILDDEKSTLEAQKKKALKLQGYSNSNFDVLKMVDDSYENSVVIAGLRVKQDHSFYQNSKVMDEEDIQTLKDLAINKIMQTGKRISQGDFAIEPKIVDEIENVSCKFCKFKDLCYHTYKDTVFLKSDKTFLKKEDKNGVD